MGHPVHLLEFGETEKCHLRISLRIGNAASQPMLVKGQNTKFQQLVGLLLVNKDIERRKIFIYDINVLIKYEINVLMQLR